MQFARYDRTQLSEQYRRQLDTQVAEGKLTIDSARELSQEYDDVANRTTYLE